MKIILASASPRRERLLARLARNFSVAPAHINESVRHGESFLRACVRLAEAKARNVSCKRQGAIVIGADTIAYQGKRIYRKTGSRRAARAILQELSGIAHYVITGVAVVYPDGKCVKYAVRAKVSMKKLAPNALECYLKGGEWKGRAGSYDVSGKGKGLVEKITGEKETVIGLPLKRLRLILGKQKNKKKKKIAQRSLAIAGASE